MRRHVTRAGSPLRSVQDVIAVARANPGKLTIGTINPAGALLQAHGIEPIQLRAELDHAP